LELKDTTWEGDYFLLVVYRETWILDHLIDSLLSNKQIERGRRDKIRQIVGMIIIKKNRKEMRCKEIL